MRNGTFSMLEHEIRCKINEMELRRKIKYSNTEENCIRSFIWSGKKDKEYFNTKNARLFAVA